MINRMLRHKLLATCLAALLMIGVITPIWLITEAHAASVFAVNSTLTTPDASPGNGVCDDGAGNCTLRGAIMEANALPGSDTINLAAGVTYTLATVDNSACIFGSSTGLPPIRSSITINGNGAKITRSSTPGTPAFRLLCVASNGDLTLSDVTLTGGSTPGGGGGLYNEGITTILRSTISGNVGGNGSGGSPGGGGIFNAGNGRLTIVNSTVSGNTSLSGYGGGGILNFSSYSHAKVTVVSSTITENTNNQGRGDAIADAFSPKNSITLKNSILTGTPKGSDCYGGAFVSLGYNIVTDKSCKLKGPGDREDTDPQLGLLAANGGPTMTHALFVGTPAVNAAADCTNETGAPILTDQRGVVRPQGGACDIGAFEFDGAVPSLTITKTHVDNFFQGQTNASFLITVTNSGNAPTAGSVTVTDDLSDAKGLTLVSFAGSPGSKWVCSGLRCTRADPLAAGASYDPIQLTVSVDKNANSPQVNRASVYASALNVGNFGPGNTYNGLVGFRVGDGAFQNDAGNAVGVQFVAGSTAFLDSMVMGITRCGTDSSCGASPPRSNNNEVIMSLYDNASLGGGNLIESITVTGQMQLWQGQTNAIVIGTSVKRPQLVAGTTYWLVATVPNLADALIWGQTTNAPSLQSTYVKFGAAQWAFQSSYGAAFQINGTQFLQPTISATAVDSVTVGRGFLLNALSPSKAPTGAPDYPVSAIGSGFVSGAVVQWTSTSGQVTPLSTTFKNSSLLETTLPASLLTTAGTARVAVVNMGGDLSKALKFEVGPPVLDSITPSSAGPGADVSPLRANGSDFLNGASVRWIWSSRPSYSVTLTTSFKTGALLEANVPASLLTTPGTAEIAVVNPNGSVSNSRQFKVEK